MEAIHSSETSVHTRSTQRRFPKDGILRFEHALFTMPVCPSVSKAKTLTFILVDGMLYVYVDINYSYQRNYKTFVSESPIYGPSPLFVETVLSAVVFQPASLGPI
jgi:hypothetical protein